MIQKCSSRLRLLLLGQGRQKLHLSLPTSNKMRVIQSWYNRNNQRDIASNDRTIDVRKSHGWAAPPSLQPYDYTAGRWLKDDRLQRESRHIEFNFPELCNKALEVCTHADSIQKCEKQEGGFNRVFLFTMNNGEQIVAKLPTSICGPPRLTTNSEVATMAYSSYKYTSTIGRNTNVTDSTIQDKCTAAKGDCLE